jgi:two-component system sensor histidine kinase and response regulator WspE
MSSGFEDSSLFDLFRMEAEEQVRVLQTGLIQLEAGAASTTTREALMRASHSLKGAARIVGLDLIVHLTHAMEDCFVAAQGGRALNSEDIDRMLTATDWLSELQAVEEGNVALWLDSNGSAIDACTAGFHEQPSSPEQETQAADPANEQATEAGDPAVPRSEDPLRTRPDTEPDIGPDRRPGNLLSTAPASASIGNHEDANSDRDIFSHHNRV